MFEKFSYNKLFQHKNEYPYGIEKSNVGII